MYYLCSYENLTAEDFINLFNFFDQSHSNMVSYEDFQKICSPIIKDDKFKLAAAITKIDKFEEGIFDNISFEKFKELISLFFKKKNG